MECDHAPRHHGLRTGHGRSSFPSRSSHTDKQRHAQSNQKHEQERNAGSGHPLPARFDMPGFHHHTQYESGKQHLDMNTALLAEIIFGKQVNQLGNTENHDRIGQNRPPILPQLIRTEFLPPQPQQQKDDHHDDEKLPAQTDHQDLQRYHQQDGVQVVENRQHLNFPIHPASLEPQGREHREQDAGRSRSGKTAQQQILFPGVAIAPKLGRQQHENIVQSDEQPGYGCRSHGDKIVLGIGAPTFFIDLEFPADIDHDERQTDIEKGRRPGPECRIALPEHPRKNLGSHEAKDEKQGK